MSESSSLFDSDGDNTAQAAKTSGGNLTGLIVTNSNGADAYIQFFDAATTAVTVGTTTPKLSILVPANGGVTEVFHSPVNFNDAITYACTTTATGNTDPTTGLTVNILFS